MRFLVAVEALNWSITETNRSANIDTKIEVRLEKRGILDVREMNNNKLLTSEFLLSKLCLLSSMVVSEIW